ncbi:MAG: mandelate racemase, partial [Bradymonadaceae bacterium]
ALHVPVCCAAPNLRHLEYFHDHIRLERAFLETRPELINGYLQPDLSRAGHGLRLRRPPIQP